MTNLKPNRATTGRAPDELVEDAMAGYLAELAQLRNTLDGRYDQIKSGQVKALDGEGAFNDLRKKSKDRRRSRAVLSSTRKLSQTSKKSGNTLPLTIWMRRTVF